MAAVENVNNAVLNERIRQSFNTLNAEQNVGHSKQENNLGKQKSIPNALWLDSYTNKIKAEFFNSEITDKNGAPTLRAPQLSTGQVDQDNLSSLGRFVEVIASLKQSQENISTQNERTHNSQTNSSQLSQADFQSKLDAFEQAKQLADDAKKKLGQAEKDLTNSTDNVSEKKQALQIAQTALKNARAHVTQLSETLSKQETQASAAKQVFEAAQKAALAAKSAAETAPEDKKESAELKAKELAEKAEQAKQAAKKAADQVVNSKNSLAQASQAVSNLSQKFDLNKTQYEQAEKDLTTISTKFKSVEAAATRANQVLSEKQTATGLVGTPEQAKKQIDQIKTDTNISAQAAAANYVSSNPQKTNAARLAEVLASLEALISDTILEEQKANVAQAKKRMTERADFQMKEQKKADEAAAKAAKVSWWTKLFSKIAGAILTVVGVIAAAFTGGASLVLAGIGLALFVADSIAEAVTGKSLTGEILGPVMKFIVEMVKKLTDVITDALVKAGMDEKIAKGLSTAIAAITAVLVVVLIVAAAAVGAKALLPKIAGSITSLLSKKLPMMLQVAEKMAPSAAKSVVVTSLKIASTKVAAATAAKTAGQTAAKEIAKRSTEAVVAEATKSGARSGTHMVLEAGAKYTQAAGQVVQGVTSGSGSIVAADLKVDVAAHQVKVFQAEAVVKAISKTLDDNAEVFTKLSTVSQSLFETMNQALSNENALATRMINNIRHRGA